MLVTKESTQLVIIQVSSGLKKSPSLANVSTFMLKSCVTVGSIHTSKCLALYSLRGLPLNLSPLTEDTSVITVSRCGIKLQEVLSGLEKK